MSIFDKANIRPYNLKELHEKTLKIIIIVSDGLVTVCGQDVADEKMYVIHQLPEEDC
jgi:hypothetical protein